MIVTTRDLLYQYIEAASLWHLKALNALITFLKFLMIESELAEGVITPYKHFCKVEENRLAVRSDHRATTC